MQKKKILHLISGLEVGGTETQLLRILPELQKYHENAVCCVRGHGPIGFELEKKSIPVYYLDFKGFLDLLIIKRFYSVIKEFRPNILTTYLIHADLYGRIFGRLFGIKKIVSSKRGALLQWEWLAKFDRMTKFMVSRYLVQTKTAREEWMGRLGLSKDNFTIIPNGIDTKLFSPNINKPDKLRGLDINPESFVITCVARLRRGKGHKFLLESFENIFKKHKNTTLLLVGDGEREEELRKQIKNYTSKNNIFFLGNRNDIPEILAISDIFVLPTEAEGMSNAIIEAMAAGIPIITTDIPENKELIKNSEMGILIPTQDIKEIQKNSSLLLNNADLRKRLGGNARSEIKKHYDINVVVEKMQDFYKFL
jgi:glycosyltransferase involved in cell wall biosynthesis